MNIARWLLQAARNWPDRPALAAGTEAKATYRQFADTAAALGAHLHDKYGVGPGARVVVYLPNSVQYLQALFGIWWSGAVGVPVNYKLHPSELAYIVEDVATSVVLVASSDADRLRQTMPFAPIAEIDAVLEGLTAERASPDPREEPIDLAPEDCAWIFYSSGTTGRPKGVMLSHDNLVAMAFAYLADVDDVGPGEASLYAAPISHGAGLYCLVHVLRGSLHVVPASGGFDAAEVLDLAEHWGNVSMFAAPTMVRRLVAVARTRDEPGRGLKTVVYGGGPMYLADVREAMTLMGDRFVQIFGQAESPMTITVLTREEHGRAFADDDDHTLSSVGRPHSNVSVRVVTSDGTLAPTDVVGEIEVRGPTTMLGYWNNPDATRAAVKDGWLRTGDLGAFDAIGMLTLVGRSKEVVISGGSNVYPREVEDVLIAHPGVQEAAVIGAPDAEWGEILVAFVVTTPGQSLTADDLDGHCLQHTARFKRPKRYHFVSELPKNNNGKVVKTGLLAEHLAAESARV